MKYYVQFWSPDYGKDVIRLDKICIENRQDVAWDGTFQLRYAGFIFPWNGGGARGGGERGVGGGLY